MPISYLAYLNVSLSLINILKTKDVQVRMMPDSETFTFKKPKQQTFAVHRLMKCDYNQLYKSRRIDEKDE